MSTEATPLTAEEETRLRQRVRLARCAWSYVAVDGSVLECGDTLAYWHEGGPDSGHDFVWRDSPTTTAARLLATLTRERAALRSATRRYEDAEHNLSLLVDDVTRERAEHAALREALKEVDDWFATMPLADLGVVGEGYLGRDVIERADAVADRVRAALDEVKG